LENEVNNALLYTLRLAFADFFVKLLIEKNPKAGGGDQPIKCLTGREKIHERMEN
jgi:hypothetical protein